MFSSLKLNLFYSRRELEKKILLLLSYVLVKKKRNTEIPVTLS